MHAQGTIVVNHGMFDGGTLRWRYIHAVCASCLERNNGRTRTYYLQGSRFLLIADADADAAAAAQFPLTCREK